MTNDAIYISTLNRSNGTAVYSLSAIRASDGALLWCNSSPLETEVTQIIAACDTLYVLAKSHSPLEIDSVEAWRADNGSLLWRNRIEQVGSGPLVVDQGIVYVSCFSPHGIYALRASDGSLLWHWQSEQDVSHCAVSKGIVYVTLRPETACNDCAALIALRASDGTLLWYNYF